ncbi:MAG: methyl-accepting chemotaxis protein [Lentilitoribacter sp.]
MKNISISKRIGLGVVIPLMGMFAITCVHVWQGYREYESTKIMDHISIAVNGLTALTHNMQVERGTSAGFVGGSSLNVPQSVVQARANTDTEIDNLKTILAGIDHAEAPILFGHMEDFISGLSSVPKFRQTVDRKTTNVDKVLGFYSKHIKTMFDIGFESAQKAPDTTIALELTSMLDLGSTKELAGKERGLTSGLLGAGKITPEQYNKLQALISPQSGMINNFVNHLPQIHKEEYTKLLEGTNLSAVNALRNSISANRDNLAESGVTQSKWFKTATDRIVKLRQLEQLVGLNIYKSVHTTQAEKFQSLMMTIIIAFGICIIASLAGFFISRSITKPMERLQDDMNNLADGNVDFAVEGTKENNELGIMALALEGFQNAEIQKRELEAAAEADQKARAEERARNEAEKAKQDEAYRQAVDTLGAGLERFSNGDFENPIEDKFPAVLADLRVYYNDTLKKLAKTLAHVRSTGVVLNNDANTLRRATTDLSRRTEAQAASLEETSTALKQITTNLRESATRTDDATNQISKVTLESASSGEVVTDAVTAMKRIENTSGEISQIVSVIDEIAFQTNLLALNAGVEAARAGEAGKGFAVVAQEVRELAQRSASAAKEIAELINNSSKEVLEGVNLVTETGNMMRTITTGISEIEQYMHSISEATSEQSAGLDQINTAVTEMDEATHKNAEMVEQANDITDRVSNGSDAIRELMAQFKTRSLEANLRSPKNRGELAA